MRVAAVHHAYVILAFIAFMGPLSSTDGGRLRLGRARSNHSPVRRGPSWDSDQSRAQSNAQRGLSFATKRAEVRGIKADAKQYLTMEAAN